MKKIYVLYILVITTITGYSQAFSTSQTNTGSLGTGSNVTQNLPSGLPPATDSIITSNSASTGSGDIINPLVLSEKQNRSTVPHEVYLSNENYVFSRIYQKPMSSPNEIQYDNEVIENITYFDGLGRAKQQRAIKASPNGGDIVTHIEYDNYGREKRKYLPFEAIGTKGAYKTVQVNTDINNYYKTTYPDDYTGVSLSDVNAYSEKVFEASPLNRVVEQGAPGTDWKAVENSDTDHTIKFDWNTNSENEVIRFEVTYENTENRNFESPKLLKNGFYAADQLYVTINKDENWQLGQLHLNDHTTREYKDKEGRVLLKRTYMSGNAHDTYYVYDRYGNLTFVLPPKAISAAHVASNYSDFNHYISVNSFWTIKGRPGPNNQGGVNFSYSNNKVIVSFDMVIEPEQNMRNGRHGALTDLPDMHIGTFASGQANYNISVKNGYLHILGTGAISHFKQTYSITFNSQYETIATETLDKLSYQYHYDNRNRLIEKKIPGKDWEYIIYNKLDQPVLTQDATLRSKRRWLFTKYDAFGRVAYTGVIENGSTIALLRTKTSSETYSDYETKRTEPIIIAGTPVYYTANAYPVRMYRILTINYYDDYTFDTAGITNPGTSFAEPITTNTKSFLTGSKVRILNTNDWITTVNYYDKKGRTIYVASKNEYLNTTDIIETELDFVGKVKQTKTTHTKDSNVPIETLDTFTYDHIGRLLTQNQVINNQTPEIIVTNQYGKLGQLKSKEIGGGLQNVDYSYNVRGWLKGINGGTTANGDVFGFNINYNTPQHGATALFNGNISETGWKTANDNVERHYKYSYDALNRITDANYNSQDNSEKDWFRVFGITYDKNGNLKSLKRHKKGSLNQSVALDYLTYIYDTGNELLTVEEQIDSASGFEDGVNTGDDYAYDANGNMVSDANKGITSITYNHLNLPETVTINNTEHTGSISYIYDATGAKQRKIATDGGSVTTDYAGNYVYKNGVLEFFNHPEGIVEHEADGYKYVYQFKDHLGNIRLSYKDFNKDGSISQSEIIQEKNYYPFGLEHKGYNNTFRGRNHNYGYNGKEEQSELGLEWLDFHARSYDASLARWMNIDPHAENYFSISPYVSFANNPISFVDPTGMDISFWKYNNETNKWETATYDELDEKTQKSLEAFAKTNIGNKFLSKFAKKGDKIGEVEFGEDGVYSRHELAFGETNYWYAPDGASNVKNKNDKLVFEWTVNNASKRELKKVENLAMSNGHEVFVHFERYLDKLIEAYDSGDMEKVDRLFAEKREISNQNSARDHKDHKKYINNDPKYNRMKIYQTQLKQVLNPKAVRQAIIEHDNKFKHLKN